MDTSASDSSPDSPPRRSRRAGPLAAAAGRGLLAALLGTAAAHAVAALLDPSTSPVLAVGSAVIDATPTPVKEWAVATFGTADKPILIGSVAIVSLILAAVAGIVYRRRPAVGIGLLLVLTGLAAAAAATRPTAGLLAPLPALVAALVGVITLQRLSRTRPTDDQRGLPSQPTRRGLLAAGGVGLAAAGLGAGGQAVIQSRRSPTLTLPQAARPAGALPTGLEGEVPGLVPFVTPNADFYRIDTALIVPSVDPTSWRLTIDGAVDEPFELTLAELLAMPMVEKDITMTCVSNEVGGPYIGSARWLGVPVRELLERAGVRPEVDQILSTSADGMTISTPVQALMDDREALVAVGMNGEQLPARHGFPVRLVTPRLYGFVGSTKWLTSLTATTYADQEAYWTERDWAIDAPVLTQSRIDTPRPLARLQTGDTIIGGVAWAQGRGIDAVEVRVDDGEWRPATLGPEAGIDYWRQWYLRWDATEGRHDLQVRARDSTGEWQTDERATPFPSGATGRHRVAVTVR